MEIVKNRKRKAFTEVMEAIPANVSNTFETCKVEHSGHASGTSFDFYGDHMATPPTRNSKRKTNPKSQHMQKCSTNQSVDGSPMLQVPISPPGVSNCYVFKSRLQEYAQKVGLTTPVYETIKDGPSHQPSFTSTVIVGGARYDSLPGFMNRKVAEQSAAEIALMELSKCGKSKESICVPVHETGLCKNLLQDYSQKMNYAVPAYICKKDETLSKTLPFSCTVEIGGIRYIGASAKTRKEAEIKAARTALLAIQSTTSESIDNLNGKTHHTVVPTKRKAPETDPSLVAKKPKKPKRSRFKKRRQNPLHCGKVREQIPPENVDILGSNDNSGKVSEQIPPENVDILGSNDNSGKVSEQIPPENVDILGSNDNTGTSVVAVKVQNGSSDVLASNGDIKTLVEVRQSQSGLSEGQDTNHEREEKTVGTTVSPVTAGSPAKQELVPPVSENKVSAKEAEFAVEEDRNMERKDNEYDASANGTLL